jgi:ParB family transcriptional regulator, chromosome partitioning protein
VAAETVMQTPIGLVKVGNRARKDLGNLDALAASIEQLGLLQPIGIDPNYCLVFGERRLRAFEQLGRDTIPARIVHVPSLLLAEHAENEIRKDFTASERVAIGQAIEAEIGDRRGGNQYQAKEHVQNFAQADGQKTRQLAAEKAGFGNAETYRQAKAVVTNGTPELIEAMDRGDVAISTAAVIASAPAETQRYAAENPKEAPAIAHNHRAQGTGENEWYTPAEYIDAARAVLGRFDLDPASSSVANRTVGAERFFTLADNGLEQPWHGRVWLNPPYAQPAIAQFSEKLSSEWEAGNLLSAIALTHNYTDTAWFHRLAGACSAICFTRGRIGFINPQGQKAAPTQGQAFFYFGPEVASFAATFSRVGFVVEVRQ